MSKKILNKPTKEELTECYVEQKLSIIQIAERVGVSPGTIWKWLKKHNIPIRVRKITPPPKEKLYELYITQELTTYQIAEIYGISTFPIVKWLKQYHIPLRMNDTPLFGQSLLDKYPEIAQEYDCSKNKIPSNQVCCSSSKKAHWICPKGHSYKTTISNRTNKNKQTGCPYCGGQQVVIGETDLATTHPELIKEWDNEKNTIKPTEASAGSDRKIWWKCKLGHFYQASISNRTNKNKPTGCPYCCGHKPILGETDLYTTHKELVDNEWDFSKNTILPTEISPGVNKKVWWKCQTYNHSWKAQIRSRTSKTQPCGCPYCSGRKTSTGFNDLYTSHKKLVDDEWDYEKNIVLPTEISTNSNNKVWWKCPQYGHSWKAQIGCRTNKDKPKGCPYCSGRFPILGETDLYTKYKTLVDDEWDFEKNTILPTEVSFGSGKSVYWKCSKRGHSWKTKICNRTKKDKPSCCPKCNESHGEKRIARLLDEHNIEYTPQYRITNCRNKLPLPFDFYIPGYGLIEFHGRQHYKIGTGYYSDQQKFEYRQKNDQIKSQYCKDHHIKLLIINYKQIDQIEEILLKKLKLTKLTKLPDSPIITSEEAEKEPKNDQTVKVSNSRM